VEPVKVAAYTLCYREAELARFNVRRTAQYVDEFVVTVGPMGRWATERDADPDTAGALLDARASLLGQSDLRVASGVWRSKNEAAAAALAMTDAKAVLQLDADEFWSEAALETALCWLHAAGEADDPCQLAFPHAILVGDGTRCLADGAGNLDFFWPERAFHVPAGCSLTHLPCRIWPEECVETIRVCHPIWHAGWVSKEQVRRKVGYYLRDRPQYSHRSVEHVLAFCRGDELEVDLCGRTRHALPYVDRYGEPPDDVVRFVRGAWSCGC
jgi:hypothetical protein